MNTMIINVKHLIFFVTITVVCLVFAASCGNTKPSGGDKKDDTLAIKPIIDTVELVTSLEELYSYAPKNTVIETCDLSHLGLKEIPMLRQYNIKSLDLSNNEMRLFEGYRLFLPPSVENLYLDSCYIGDIRREDYCAKEDFTTTENSLPDEFTSSQQAKVVVNESKLFVLPTSLNIDADTKALFATKLTYDSLVEIVLAPMPPTDFNGVNFYAVKITLNDNEVIGYIDSRTVINVEDETLENVPVPNASTRAETIVYSDSNCENEVETIPQGTNVRIISSNDGVSFIQYFIEDNGQTIIKEGYVRTSFLDDGTLTLTQILGIVLMCVSLIVAIIVAIVISKNKKKKEL